jgi:hypothetical protein
LRVVLVAEGFVTQAEDRQVTMPRHLEVQEGLKGMHFRPAPMDVITAWE